MTMNERARERERERKQIETKNERQKNKKKKGKERKGKERKGRKEGRKEAQLFSRRINLKHVNAVDILLKERYCSVLFLFSLSQLNFIL